MNGSDFEALMGNTFGNLTKLSASKGLEYSGETDRLANFKDQAKLLGFASPIQVLGVYLNKHLGSINKFIAGGTASSEPIEGRIDDAILYLVLLKALISERQTPKDPLVFRGNPQTRYEALILRWPLDEVNKRFPNE